MQPSLIAITGPLTGRVYPIPDAGIVIGWSRENQLSVDETEVVHPVYRLAGTGGAFKLIESGAEQEVARADSRPMTHGSSLRVDTSEFLFVMHEGEDKAEQPMKQTAGRSSAGDEFALEVGRMARDLAALIRISNVINSIRDVRMLQQELLSLIGEVVPAAYAAVVLAANGDFSAAGVCRWSRDPEAEQPELRQEMMQRALWEAVTVTEPAGPQAGKRVVCVPLKAIERTVGVLYLESADGESIVEDHGYFLDSVSRIAAVTLENMLALDDLKLENRQLRRALSPAVQMVGQSRAMAQVESFVSKVAKSDTTVLIRGESGTGKEVVARSIHSAGARAERPFVAINCAAIPETLIESELFGNEKGAFTGAVTQRRGKFEVAEDGTVFLDEIGELPPAMQAKLLRVLQQREFERVGGSKTLPMRARVLAATNKDLEKAIKDGEFRQDLYYRLNVVGVSVPPLRRHREDIPLLALHFAGKYAARANRPFRGISSEARTLLLNYDWPGNVRELENAIEHAMVLGLTDEILAEDLPAVILEQQAASLGGALYYDAVNARKKELLLDCLAQAKGNFPEAARLLGIHPKYLHRLAKNLHLKEGKE